MPTAKRSLDPNGKLIWQRFSACRNRPKASLNDQSIATFFVTVAIELLWQCKAGGWNHRNGPSGPLAAVLAHRNSRVFFYSVVCT